MLALPSTASFKNYERYIMDNYNNDTLKAVDAALNGIPVSSGQEDVEAIVRLVQANRPEPSEEVRVRLDQRRPNLDNTSTKKTAKLASALKGLALPRVLLPSIGGLCVLILVVVAVSSSSIQGAQQPTAESTGPTRDTLIAPDTFERSMTTPESTQSAGADSSIPSDSVIAPEPYPLPSIPPSDGEALDRRDRKVERTASLTIGMKSEEIPDAVNEAVKLIAQSQGVVISSQLTGYGEDGSAALDLRIPAEKLSQTMAGLSGLGSIEAIEDNSLDITGSFVSMEDQRKDLGAERVSLRKELVIANGGSEREALKGQIRTLNDQIESLSKQQQDAEQRTIYSRLSLRFTSQASPVHTDNDGWGIRDAASKSMQVLNVIAGVILFAATLTAPFLVFGFALWAIRKYRLKKRTQVLDQ